MDSLSEVSVPIVLGTLLLALIIWQMLGVAQEAPAQPVGPSSPAPPAPPAAPEVSKRFVLPLGLRLADPFLPHLAHDQYMRYRQDYQRFREGEAAGARGEASELPTLEWDAAGTEDFDDVVPLDHEDGATLRNLPALFEVDRHLERGGDVVLQNRPDIIEELQARINDFRFRYSQYRKGHAFGAGSQAKLLRLLKAAPVDMLPTAQLRSIIRQSKELKDRKRRLPTQSEANLHQILSEAAARLHVHFGAGRLGLGLVVPAICRSNCPFAIINPPFDEFNEFIEKHRSLRAKGGNTVVLENNDEVYGRMTMITDIEDLPILRKFLNDVDRWNADAPRPGILAVTNDERLTSLLIGKAKTFSTSVGPGMPKTAEALKKFVQIEDTSEKKIIPSLAACENDHHAVEEMATKLEGTVAVVGCLVDRISTYRALDLSGEAPLDMLGVENPSYMRVRTEPWPGLIMIPPFKPDVFAYSCPFVGDQVLRPKLPAEANYITRRKIVTVNGMHTTLAFLSLNAHAEKKIRDELAAGEKFTLKLENDKLLEEEASLPLVTVATADDATEKTIWSWVVARQLLLLFEVGVEVMMIAHDIDSSLSQQEREQQLCDIIWKYARDCVLRFDTTNDTCGRVLGGGVVNRLRTRLRPVHAFLDANPNLNQILGGVAATLLRTAEVDPADMRKRVAALNAAAEAIVGLRNEQ